MINVPSGRMGRKGKRRVFRLQVWVDGDLYAVTPQEPTHEGVILSYRWEIIAHTEGRAGRYDVEFHEHVGPGCQCRGWRQHGNCKHVDITAQIGFVFAPASVQRALTEENRERAEHEADRRREEVVA